MISVAGGIITKGLGRPACAGMIVNFFSLALAIGVTPPTPPAGGGGGGPYPGPAWNVMGPGQIQNFYKPYVPDHQHIHPILQPTRLFYIRINFRGQEIEKMYEVTEKSADTIASVLNVADRARNRIKITVSNIRRVAPSISDLRRVVSKITVAIKDLRTKK